MQGAVMLQAPMKQLNVYLCIIYITYLLLPAHAMLCYCVMMYCLMCLVCTFVGRTELLENKACSDTAVVATQKT